MSQFMKHIVKLTKEILELRDQEVDEYDEDEDDNDLDALDAALEIKGKKITLGKYDNKDLEQGEDEVYFFIQYDEDDEFRETMTYDSPLDEVCEILFL